MSDEVVLRRIRNRQIEYLEVVADRSSWRKVFGTSDALINWWEDWFQVEKAHEYAPPTYTAKELKALHHFHRAWGQAMDAPTASDLADIPDDARPWRALASAAQTALEAFAVRGRLLET